MDLESIPYDPLDAALLRTTQNWAASRWRGHILWQNLLDLNVITEHIFATRPELIVETGTFYGGSAIFYSDIMRLAGVEPAVISIDIAPLATPAWQGVRYFAGMSSTDPHIVSEVTSAALGKRTFIVLDSDHSSHHVYQELRSYAPLVRGGDYLLVQDGNMYSTMRMPIDSTPLGGIARYLAETVCFEVDESKSPFGTTSHIRGWLRRVG